MEGEYKPSAESADGKSNTVPSPLSWSSLLKGSVIGNRIPQSLSYYVKFYLRYAKRLEGLTWPSELPSHKSEVAVDLLNTSDVKNNPAHVWKGKEFHIALITHKYPAREKVFYYHSFFDVDTSDYSRDKTSLTAYYFVFYVCSFLQIRKSNGHLMLKLCFFPTAS